MKKIHHWRTLAHLYSYNSQDMSHADTEPNLHNPHIFFIMGVGTE